MRVFHALMASSSDFLLSSGVTNSLHLHGDQNALFCHLNHR